MEMTKVKALLFGDGGIKRTLIVGVLLSCCGLSIVVLIWGFLFGFPPSKTDSDFVTKVESSELRNTIPLGDDEVRNLLRILNSSAKGGDVGFVRVFSGQHFALASRIREIVKADLKLFSETLAQESEEWRIEEIQKIEAFESRFSDLDKSDELFRNIEPIVARIKELSPIIEARKLKLSQQNLRDSVATILLEFRPTSSNVEKLISDLRNAIQKDSDFSAEGSKLLRQLDPVLAKARLIDEAGPAPEELGADGYGVQTRMLLRRTLNDYDSSEFLEWVGPVLVERGGEYYWQVKLTLRAKNLFGAYIIREVRFYFRNGKLVDFEGLG